MILEACCYLMVAVPVVLPGEPMQVAASTFSEPTGWVSLSVSPRLRASGAGHGDTNGRRVTDPVCSENEVRQARRRRAQDPGQLRGLLIARLSRSSKHALGLEQSSLGLAPS